LRSVASQPKTSSDSSKRVSSARIQPHRLRIDGKQRRVYDVEDFQTDERGFVRGTPGFTPSPESDEAKAAREDRKLILMQKLTAEARLNELNRVEDELEEDEPSLKERWRRIRAAIDYEREMLKS